VSWTRRTALLGAGAAVGAVVTRQIGSQSPSMAGLPAKAPDDPTELNDASLLSPTPIAKHTILRDDSEEALLRALRAELSNAVSERRPINVGAARHSMGAQAIPRDGHAITFDNGWVEAGHDRYRCHAGARWHQVIAALDPLRLSPMVMQSNHDFGVAATFSVGAHGWATAHGPMGSTVHSLKMLLADGSHITASPTENAQLFSAAMGGYGLIGLITELEVAAAPNQLLTPTFAPMPSTDFAVAFSTAVKSAPMAYGRLNVDRDGFFQDAMLVTYSGVEGDIPAATTSGLMSKASRLIFRAQTGNEWVKHRRWGVETGIGAWVQGQTTRNSLFNEPVLALEDRDLSRTDILHEYFVAPERFLDFVNACRDIIPQSYQELLNVTLRWVEQDRTSVLSYAPYGPRISAVLLFSQEMSARAEADMARMTEALIDAVAGIGGAYYLPYRPHARLDQFTSVYKRADEFVALKRQVDPGLTLRGGLWDNYLGKM
jgi:FAD/FMN-containing dehydrogenase